MIIEFAFNYKFFYQEKMCRFYKKILAERFKSKWQNTLS